MASKTQTTGWTLRRSCDTCARAKKRCDLTFPKCSRCKSRDLDCLYSNEPTQPCARRAVGTRSGRVAPRPVASANKLDLQSAQTCPPDDRIKTRIQYPHLVIQQPSFYGVPLTLDADTLRFLVTHLTSFPATFAETGTTPFVDLSIYEYRLPEAVTDIWALCAAASPGASSSKVFLAHVLDTKTVQLVRSANTAASFVELLTMVQALILALIIRLYAWEAPNDDETKNDAFLKALGKLTLRLWQQAPNQISASLTPRQAWLFGESVRRTILTSHMLRGTYTVIRQGYFLHTTFVEALPFDLRTSLWDRLSSPYDPDDAACRVANIGTKLVSYREYTDMWGYGQVHGHTTFGALLLVACKGKDALNEALPRSARQFNV